MTDLEIRKDIIETARRMLEKGLVQGTGGNFSVRCEEGFIITPSGMDYATLTPGDLPKLSPGGAVLEGERRPSIEKELHREVYLARRDVCAVVHTHSVYATAAAAMRIPLPVLTDNQAVLFGGPVPVAEYAPIGTPELAREAQRLGADYVGCGAAFETATKGDAVVIGPDGIKKVLSAIDIPSVAIGGIELGNVKYLAGCGASGISLSGAIMRADDPKEAAAALIKEAGRVLRG